MSLLQKMMETSPGTILAVPNNLHAPEPFSVWFSWWMGGLGLLVIPWAIRRLVKKKDATFLLVVIGGLIASVFEPMVDHLGHLWWPTNLPGPVYVGFGVEIPYLIPPCYIFIVSMTMYYSYQKMRQGLTVTGVFGVWLQIFVIDIALEIPATAIGIYSYYGDVPYKILGFPLAWGWMNSTLMIFGGLLLLLIVPNLKGWRKVLLIFVPIVGMSAGYGFVGWPYFLALNWPMPVYAVWLLTTGSFFWALLMVRFIAGAVVGVGSPQTPSFEVSAAK